MANAGPAEHDGRRPHLLNKNVLFIVGFLVIGIISWLAEIEMGLDSSAVVLVRRGQKKNVYEGPPSLIPLQSFAKVFGNIARAVFRVVSRTSDVAVNQDGPATVEGHKRHAPIPDRKECNSGCHFAGISYGTGLV